MHGNDKLAVHVAPAYVIKNDAGMYMQVTRTDDSHEDCGKKAEVRWTSNKALASRWNIMGTAYCMMWKLNGDGVAIPSGGWVVGLDVAQRLMQLHGGHLVYVRSKNKTA